MVETRAYEPADAHAVDTVLRDAFHGGAEANLVTALRQSGDVIAEFVAVEDGEVCGMAMLTRLSIGPDGEALDGAALAPVAVSPTAQGAGVGKTLCRSAIDHWDREGNGVIVVLGEPTYYKKLGFRPDLARTCLESPFADVGEAFMMRDPQGRLSAHRRAPVRYPAPFGIGDRS